MISNVCSRSVCFMTYLLCLLLLIMQIKLKNIRHQNISTQFFSKNDNFAMNMYRKETFTGFYNNFESVIPLTNKIGLIKLLF